MPLAYELDSTPTEELKTLYKEVNGKYVLDVEGVVPVTQLKETQAKLDEFRTNNTDLKKQLEKVVKTPLHDVKPSDIDMDTVLKRYVADMQTEFETKLADATTQISAKDAMLERVVLSDAVKEAAIVYGVHDTAIADVLNRAKEMFTVKDGVAVPREAKVDKDGKPYSIQSWIQGLSHDAPHLFEPSRGSGSQKSVKGIPITKAVSGIDRIAKGLKDRSK